MSIKTGKTAVSINHRFKQNKVRLSNLLRNHLLIPQIRSFSIIYYTSETAQKCAVNLFFGGIYYERKRRTNLYLFRMRSGGR